MTCDNCGCELTDTYFVQDEQHAYMCRQCWQESVDAWRFVYPGSEEK